MHMVRVVHGTGHGDCEDGCYKSCEGTLSERGHVILRLQDADICKTHRSLAIPVYQMRTCQLRLSDFQDAAPTLDWPLSTQAIMQEQTNNWVMRLSGRRLDCWFGGRVLRDREGGHTCALGVGMATPGV